MKDAVDLLAWIGEDEFGSGKIGIKQAYVAAGCVPIVAVLDDKPKVARQAIVDQMQHMSDQYGKTIRLVRYEPVEEIIVVRPRGHG